MKALIDPKIIDTPIGQCVALPAEAETLMERWSHDDFIPGDLLAVVQTCPNAAGCSRAADWHGIGFGPAPDCACEKWQSIHIRHGFVQVIDTLPVYKFTPSHRSEPYVALDSEMDGTPVVDMWDGGSWHHNIDLTASPYDLALIVEPWCLWIEDGPVGHNANACRYCKPTPVTVTHRDGVLGEIGDET